jgi:uncharacterized protein YegJ (DUF2314 family)
MWLLEFPYRLILIAGITATLGFLFAWARIRFLTDPVVEIDPDDPETLAAVSRARSTLRAFWRAFEAPAPEQSHFAVKVRFPIDGGGEQVWCQPTARNGSEIIATLINRPQVLTLREGQSVSFDEADITDWCYRQSDRLVGGESMKLMLTKLSPRKARAMAAEIGL